MEVCDHLHAAAVLAPLTLLQEAGSALGRKGEEKYILLRTEFEPPTPRSSKLTELTRYYYFIFVAK
jgi:hypothetical protein